MKYKLAGVALVTLLLTTFSLGCDDDNCNWSGYTPLTVALVQSNPSPPNLIDGACVVYTDMPANVTYPDGESAKLRHIGESVYQCLTGQAVAGESYPPAMYQERLFFRTDGRCPDVSDSFFYYGCFDYNCRTVDTDLRHIGPASVCPVGSPMSQWDESCWTQFYTVLGHEVMHGWLGGFH